MARSLLAIRRWLFNAIAAVSLLLCFASVGAWVRSCHAEEWLTSHHFDKTGSSEWDLCFPRGSVAIGRVHLVRLRGEYTPYVIDELQREFPTIQHRSVNAGQSMGLGYHAWSHADGDIDNRFYRLDLPIWLLTVFFMILPMCWILGLPRCRRAKRLHLGLSPTCGYDLRATPDRCPECGTRTLNVWEVER